MKNMYKPAIVILSLAAIGLLLTFIIRAATDGVAVFEAENPELTQLSDDASEGSFIEFNGPKQAGPGCDPNFNANIFSSDFSQPISRVSESDMAKALGIDIGFWADQNADHFEVKDNYLRVEYQPTSRGSNHMTFFIDLNGGKGFEEVWWEQQIYLEEGWDWGGKNEGGKLNGVQGGDSDAPWNGPPSGGYPPRDGEGFSLRNMWRDSRNGGEEGRFVGYTYHIDQPSQYGDNLGRSDNVFVPVGEWVTLTHHVKMNTSDNQARGAGDGIWEMSVNGEKVISIDNLRLSANGNTHNIEQWMFSSFYGGNDATWSPDKTTYMRFGCIQAASADPFIAKKQ